MSLVALDRLLAAVHDELVPTPTAEVDAQVDLARAAQGPWGRLSIRARAAKIAALGQQVVQHREQLAALIVAETGKPKSEAVLHELLGAALLARYFARKAPHILAPQRLAPSYFFYRQSVLHHLPRGVVGIISPWNFPFTLPFGDVAMALLAGNAVVLKPSEVTPRTAGAIVELVAAAGIDPALVTLCLGGAPQGEALAAAKTDMMRFTGSVAVGKRIAQQCAARLVPCVLELGGKDAAVVHEDCDIEHTAQTLVYGAFANAGQVCAGIERAYIPRRIMQPLLARIVELTQRLRVAPHRNFDGPYDIGPMITAPQQAWVLKQLDEARQKGARIHCGGHASGQAIVPTVISDCDESCSVCCEESFGPVLPLIAVDSVEEAIQRANDSRFGLTAYVFGSDLQRCQATALKLEAGSVLINEVLLHHAAPEAPWGGIKDSGLGHTHSAEGLRSFCQLRHINGPRLLKKARVTPFGFPYSAATHAPVEHLLDALMGPGSLLTRLRALVRSVLALARGRR